MQFFFAYDLQGEGSLLADEEELERFWDLRQSRKPAREFATRIVRGVLSRIEEIDGALRDSLDNFAFHRVNTVDRGILRVGAWEVLYADHIPPRAALNEAIEIAKRFGGPESPRFVNGVLDKVMNAKGNSRGEERSGPGNSKH